MLQQSLEGPGKETAMTEREDSREPDAQEGQSTVRLLRAIVIVTLLAVVAVVISDGIIGGRPQIVVALLPLAVFMGISILLLNRRILWPSRLLVPVALSVVLSYLIVIGGGIHDVAMIGYAAVLVMASLTLGRDASILFGVLVVIAVAIVGVLEINGTIVNQGSFITTWDELVLISIIIMAIAGLQRLLVGQLNVSLRRARENERAQLQANQELRGLQVALENRVEERTHELAQRTRYLEATAQIVREATATLAVQDLLSRVVILIGEQFGFYHTALFMRSVGAATTVSAAGDEWLQLRAASSKVGQRLLERGQRLRVDDQGIISYVAREGRAYAAADVKKDRMFREDQELPHTCSKIVLPLRARGEIMGVLDLHSATPRAFSDEEISTLQVLADQIALAISNAQLFQQTQESLEAERRAVAEIGRQVWGQLVQERVGQAYRSRQGIVTLVPEEELSVAENGSLPTLHIPVRVRGQVVATIQARKPEVVGAWTEDESRLVETLAEQLSVALESARLYQDSQRRVAREQLIGEVTARMRESLNVETVLKTTVDEIYQKLGLDGVLVRLVVDEDDLERIR